MQTLTRNISLGLAVVALAVMPATAFARHGADDTGFDDNGGLRDDSVSDDTQPDDNGGLRPDGVSDDTQADDSRGGGDRTVKRAAGECTGDATSKLKAKLDDGKIETEFEVDQNRNGVEWKVRFRLNGERVVKTTATTKAPSGSFSVERRLADGPGSDHVVGKAISPSGQVCKAGLTI
ncbi:MAG: hypothetical protein ACJ74L_03280 [Gaiellaceae bacterium]